MKKTLISGCLIAALSLWAENTYSFKPHYEKAGRVMTVNRNIDTTVGFSRPPSLRLISSQANKSGYVTVAFCLPKEIVDTARGKMCSFSLQCMRISGTETLSMTARLWKKPRGILASKNIRFTDTICNKWQKIQIEFMMPSSPELGSADILISFVANAGNPGEFVIDEPVFRFSGNSAVPVRRDTAYPAIYRHDNRKPLILAENGKLLFKIVIPDQPTHSETYAAEEIANHAKLVFGTLPEIVKESSVQNCRGLYIGATKPAKQFYLSPFDLEPNQVVQVRLGDKIIISGGDAKKLWRSMILSKGQFAMGTVYSAGEFLERELGIRWIRPGKHGTVAPARKNWQIGSLFRIYVPSYEARHVFSYYINEPNISAEERARWYRRLRLGGFGGSPFGNHAFNEWHKKFGKDHPDYFALQRDGTRLNRVNSWGGHVCMTHPDVIRETIREKIEFFRKNPDVKYAAVMPGDSIGTYYCHCPRCQKEVSPEKESIQGRYSNAVWKFVNTVASEVSKGYPDGYITCCAYGGYTRKPDFPLHPNVAVTLCFTTSQTAVTPQAMKNRRALIREWQSSGAKLYAWEYWGSRYISGIFGAPTIYAKQLKECYLADFSKLAGRVIEMTEKDADGQFLAGGWCNWIYDDIMFYTSARLLWDINTDTDTVLDENIRLFYGPAAGSMAKFYDLMEETYLKYDHTKMWDYQVCWHEIYTPATVDRAMTLLRRAVQEAGGDPVYSFRAKQTLNGFLPFEKCSKATRSPSQNINPKTIKVKRISGIPQEEDWKKVAAYANFSDAFVRYELKSKSSFQFLHNGKTLFCRVQAALPDKMEKFRMPKGEGKLDSALWNFESMELHLASSGKHYQFIFAPYDCLADFLNGKQKWNCSQVKYSSRLTEKAWTGLLEIPLAEIRFDRDFLKNGCLFNVFRNCYYTESGKENWEQGCYLPVFGAFGQTEKYGTLTLE